MTPATDTYLLLRAFVDELARCGMRDACTSPGSRSAPLVLTLASERRLRCHSHVDERCAGFFALGLAKASGLPVAVTCTSGTAAAELLPAVIEAREARVPLLVLTADRPPELRESGAGQTIDQLKLYGDAVKWFFEVGTHESGAQRLRWMRALACRAYWTTLEGRPGVVHLNFPLREPLIAEQSLPHDPSARAAGLPYVRRRAARSAAPDDEARLAKLVGRARRGVVVAGRHERASALGDAAAAFCAAASWPLLADPLSGARRGATAVAHYDALLRDRAFAAGATPDLVIRVGDLPISKPLRQWLAGLGDVTQVALDPEGAWQDPDSVLCDSLALDPASALAKLAAEPRALAVEDPEWLTSWRHADEHAATAITATLAGEMLSEPEVAAELGRLLPANATLFVASSMPVRDLETFWPVLSAPPRVLCNRGANGIDGIVSSALGVAASAGAAVHGSGPTDGAKPVDGFGSVGGIDPVDSANPVDGVGPVVLLIGDVALAHDLGGLLACKRLGLKLTIVLLNNDGGGIFDFLPVAGASMAQRDDIYATHIATPTGLDFAQAAALYGLTHERARDASGLRAALERALSQDGAGIIEVSTHRAANVELHRRVWEAVSSALPD
ncbi:MAG TPA: 2-succinyl-5-enolpyruvyl-6-hydroxy-3-cyclohexene-1-carboxylic-acid synthase [Solirubrobacteraceae bacterium]|nr:2-succinyl-5-enolpyruvyl-6-hydroxy-3-cyclohexene-1-carboxylic-acid synthase [Solirubrobacteraceae bacterium]